MPFEKVSGSRGRGGGGSPMISLRKSGSIGLNSAVMDELLDNPEHCEVFFDEEENRLGFRGLDEPSDDSYSVSKSNGSGTLNPTSILKMHGLVPEVTTQFKPSVEKLNGDIEIVVIDCDDPIGTYGSPDTDDADPDPVPPEEESSEDESDSS